MQCGAAALLGAQLCIGAYLAARTQREAECFLGAALLMTAAAVGCICWVSGIYGWDF